MPHAVLLVDADAAARSARSEVLRHAGFRVVDAASGAEALKLVAEERPALAVIAVELPEMDGLEVCRRLKADPRTASIPVLHISSRGGPLGEPHRGYPESIESGADGWLREPVEPAALLAVATASIRAGSAAARTGKAEGDAPSNGRLAALIESIPDEVWFADAQGRFTLANPSAAREFGIGDSTPLDVKELARSLEVYRADGSPRPLEEAPPLRALRGETLRDLESIVRTPVHGELRYRQVSAAPVRDAAGNIAGSVSVVRDITARKRAEQALRASEERLRLTMGATGAGSFEYRPPTGECFWDAAAKAMWGLPPDAEIAYPEVLDRIHPEDRQRIREGLEASVTAESPEYSETEYRVIWPDGEVRWISGRTRTFFEGEGGGRHVVRVIGLRWDITVQKRAQEALRAGEERYRSLFEAMTEGFALCEVVCDEAGKPRDYRHLAANSAYERHTGVKAEDLLGRTLLEVFPAAEPVWIERYGEVAQTGEPARFEEWFGPLGRWLEVSAFQTEPGRFGVVFTDITERRRREEQIEADRQLLETVTTRLPAGVAVIRGSDLRIILANPAYQGNAPGKEMIGKTIEEAWPETQPRFGELCHHVLATGEAYDAVDEAFTIRRSPDGPAELTYWTWSLFRVSLPGDEGWGLMSVTIETTERKRVEEALRASEARHRLLAETMLQGVVHQDAGGMIIAMNPAAERILGKTREEFLGSSSVREERDSIREDGTPFPGLEHPAMVALRTGQPVRGVVMGWFDSREGARRWISIDAVPLFGQGGASPSGVYTVFEDITGRKRAEQERQRLAGELADRAGEIQAILDAAPVAVWIAHDPACQEITGNRMADRFYEAAAGENVSANVTAARRFFQGGRELEARELPMQEAAARGADIRNSELEVLLPSGRSIHMLGNASPLRDAAGEVRGCVGTFLDITGRKRAEEALRESEAVLRGFFDSPGMMRGFVDLVDGAIVHVSCNAAAAELYGVDRESIAGMTASEAGASDDVTRQWVALYEESWRTGKPVSMEYARHDADGQDSWLLATASYVGTKPSGIPRFAYTVLDLTKRKRAEEQLRQSEERYRTLFDTLLEGFCIIEVIFDAGDKPVDYRFLEINPAFEGQTGLKNSKGRLMRDLAPDHEAHWFEIYGQVALTGQPARFVNEARALNRWYDVSAYRVGGPESRRVAILFNDITEAKRAEVALRQSESQLRTLGDNLPEGALYKYRLDAGGEPHVDFISAGIERLTGVPAAEFMRDGATVERTIMPEDRARLRAAIALSRDSLTRFEVEVRHTHRSTGDVRWSLLRSTPSRCPDGSTVWDGIELDITERKRAEEALRESEAKYRAIGESIDYGVWVCDPEGRNIYTSESFLKLVGMTQEQCSSFGWGDVLHPDDAERTIAAWKECVRTEGTWDIEHRFRGVDGKWHPILARGVPIRDEQGRVTGWAGINLDISARKQAEEALRMSESRERARAAELAALMDAAPAGIFVAHSVDCLQMSGNPAAYDLLRRPRGSNLSKSAPEDEKPMNFRAMKDGIEIPLPELPIQKAAWTGQPVRKSEMEFVFEDGSTTNLLGDAVPLMGEDGRPRGAVGVFFDITELKRAETRLRDAQKLESLGLLAGGVAHDFNNLLVGVIGNASLAQEMLPPDHAAIELLEGVTKAGEQAAHLTRQMLAYSGKGKFLVEALNLSALIPEMTGLVRPSISKKVSLYLDLAEHLPPIEADRGQVQQVFMNLALNAAEAIGSHDGLISIRTGLQEVDDWYLRHHGEAALRPGTYVFLEVRDTGCGMDETTKAKIFDPFFSTKFTGRGLGLAAVAGILRGHKGAIRVDSAPGKGSCFTVLFPAVERAAGAAPEAPRNARLQGAGVVLVVDDERVVRELARRALERHGYTVLLAESGPAAIDLCKRHPGDIALIILDLGMPQMGGDEALPELRKVRPAVKVLVSSGYSEAEAMALFKGQRVSDFIQKPYTSKGLAEKVKTCLG